MPEVNFLEEKIVSEEDTNKTVLEISLKNEIPHVYACGGHARCSTCRVLILEGMENILPRNELEFSLAQKKSLEENIRIACQTKIRGNVKLKRLVIDSEDIEIAVKHNGSSGREEKIAIMFTDVRGFTNFSEKTLPYDVIHILNRYFHKMGSAVLANKGYIDKYMGDGMMCLFGIENQNKEEIAIGAIKAAFKMIEELDTLNLYLEKNFHVKFEIGIGIHFGSVILGEIGHPEKKDFTAIGDNVNFASRIESTTKKAGAKILISDEFYQIIKNRIEKGRSFVTNLKGKTGKFKLHEIIHFSKKHNSLEVLESFLNEKIPITDGPGYLRLAFHDASNYDYRSEKGGLNGSIQFELDRDENRGLRKFVENLILFQKNLSEKNIVISLPDLIAYAAKISLEKLGGPKIELTLGRKEATNEGPKIHTPHEHFTVEGLISEFEKMKFTVKDLVVLSGAHSVGKQNEIAFTENPYQFDNSYFKKLSETPFDSSFLETDKTLLNHPDTKKFVELFSHDNQFFLKEFKISFEKLLNLGFHKY